MKRLGNVFDKICSKENIALAHAKARRGKRHYREVMMVDAAPDHCFEKIHNLLSSGQYRTAPYREFTRRCSGKQRLISKLPYYPDRIVHHCIVQAVESVWFSTLIRDTYACIPKRGIHDGVSRIKSALQDKAGTMYCLKMDIQKFYPSIDHDVLKRILRTKIKDVRALALIDEVIDSTVQGVPIGNYLSQHFGNLYLSGYDHWMKEQHGCKYYFRYCDDVVVLDGDKARLHRLRELSAGYLLSELKLTVKSNWQVFPVDARGIDFLGYRFFHGYTLLRKSIALRFKRKMRMIKSGRHKMNAKSMASSAMSYDGWLAHADCKHLKDAYFIKPYLKGVGNDRREPRNSSLH